MRVFADAAKRAQPATINDSSIATITVMMVPAIKEMEERLNVAIICGACKSLSEGSGVDGHCPAAHLRFCIGMTIDFLFIRTIKSSRA